MEISLDSFNLTMFGQISKGDANKLASLLAKVAKTSPLRVVLSTPGGYRPDAHHMMKIFLNYPDACCLAKNNVHSAGILLMSGFNLKNRWATTETTFKFHYPSFLVDISKTRKQENIKSYQEWLSYRTNMKVNEIDYLMSNELEISAKDALDGGLIGKIKDFF